MPSPWAITAEKVQAAVKTIAEAYRPTRIIIFGSYAAGNVHAHSDLDLLIVSREHVSNPRQESVKLRRLLRDIILPMDILVVSESKLTALADAPGLIYREALRTGKVVYESE